MKIKTKNHYLLWIDLLGTKNKIDNDKNDEYINLIYDLYKQTLNFVEKVYKKVYKNIKIKYKIYSDNITVAIEQNDGDSVTEASYKKGIITDFATYFQLVALEKEILTRGVITIGKLYINNVFICGKALNRAYELETETAIYPRIIYDSEIVNYFLESNQLCENTNRDADGIFYIDIFKSMFITQKLQGKLNNIKTALLNIWSNEIYGKNYSEMNNKQKKQKKTNYKHLQKIYWLANVFNDYGNQHDKYLTLPFLNGDKLQILYNEGNYHV